MPITPTKDRWRVLLLIANELANSSGVLQRRALRGRNDLAGLVDDAKRRMTIAHIKANGYVTGGHGFRLRAANVQAILQFDQARTWICAIDVWLESVNLTLFAAYADLENRPPSDGVPLGRRRRIGHHGAAAKRR